MTKSRRNALLAGVALLSLLFAGAVLLYFRGDPPAPSGPASGASGRGLPPALPPEGALAGARPEEGEDPSLSAESVEQREQAVRERLGKRREERRHKQEVRHKANRERSLKRKTERRARIEESRAERENFLKNYPDPNRPAAPPVEMKPLGKAIYYEEGEEPPKGMPEAPYERRPSGNKPDGNGLPAPPPAAGPVPTDPVQGE